MVIVDEELDAFQPGVQAVPVCLAAGLTRSIPTAISLETAKGEFAQGIALGFVLIVLALGVNVALNFFQGEGGMK